MESVKQAYMGKPDSVSEKKICPVCKQNGIEIKVHAEETTYEGNIRLSWKNPDGSSHIRKTQTGFEHNPVSGQGMTNTPQILQTQKPSESNVINEVRIYVETHMELANEIRMSVMKEAQDHGYFADTPDKRTLLGFTAHDIIMAKLTPDVVNNRIAEKTKPVKKSSAETDEVAYSSRLDCFRGANSCSFHTSSAVKDEIDLWQKQSLENFAQPLFFIIRNKRFVPKCEIHGTVCNEETYECKKCIEYRDQQKHKQDLFNSSSLINRGLLQ